MGRRAVVSHGSPLGWQILYILKDTYNHNFTFFFTIAARQGRKVHIDRGLYMPASAFALIPTFSTSRLHRHDVALFTTVKSSNIERRWQGLDNLQKLDVASVAHVCIGHCSPQPGIPVALVSNRRPAAGPFCCVLSGWLICWSTYVPLMYRKLVTNMGYAPFKFELVQCNSLLKGW